MNTQFSASSSFFRIMSNICYSWLWLRCNGAGLANLTRELPTLSLDLFFIKWLEELLSFGLCLVPSLHCWKFIQGTRKQTHQQQHRTGQIYNNKTMSSF